MSTLRALLLLLAGIPAAGALADKLPPPSIGVSPSRIEVTVENGVATGSATVLNLSDRTVQISSELVNFDLDEASNLRELPPAPGTLPAAIMLNPVAFSIPPAGSQTVRFAIMAERLGGPGEHRAMLFFSEFVDLSKGSVRMQFRLGVPIYASFGEVLSAARLHDVSFEASTGELHLDVTATGNAQVRPSGFYLYWPVVGFPSESRALARVVELAKDPEKAMPDGVTGGPIHTRPVFPGARRLVSAALPAPPDSGEYMLVYAVEAGGQSVQRAVRYVPQRMLIVDKD